jgi:CRISP-associated protein Cas1
VEGAAAQAYFGVLGLLFKRSDSGLVFEGRSKHPPRDPINALLSFGYALLMRDCAAALAGVGLDPAVGFLHEDRPGRLGLALDVMEELRIPVVDRLVVSLINRGQVLRSCFEEDPSGGMKLQDAGRKLFLTAYQKAKQTEIFHPFLEQQTTWGLIPHLQARLLARTLRGDLEVYPPFDVR